MASSPPPPVVFSGYMYIKKYKEYASFAVFELPFGLVLTGVIPKIKRQAVVGLSLEGYYHFRTNVMDKHVTWNPFWVIQRWRI